MALRGALQAGHKVLDNDGEALDAVVAAIEFMESESRPTSSCGRREMARKKDGADRPTFFSDCPLFNSGHGAVFNTEGKNELEW